MVSRRQLAAMRLGPGAIDQRVSSGWLHVVHRGVYAVGHPRLVGLGPWMAAVLACGEGALLSHRAAAALWDIAPYAGELVEVTTPRSRRGCAGVVVHRSRRLHPEDTAVHEGIPVTSLARTLCDLAEVVSRGRLERAFEAAERRRVLDMAAVERVMERGRGRHGVPALRRLVADYRSEAAETRSELERRFLDFCRQQGLPLPAMNAWVAGFEVDAFWPGLVVELDSWEYHRTRASFERDRARDAALQLHGYPVIRITSRALSNEPERVEATVRRLADVA